METLPLSDIIITIDTREQNQKRIKAVESWGVTNGAIVEHSKLDLCDYRIMGTFRDHEINIGIEAKGLSDFCSCDYEDLKRKLFDSFELYDEVALFIESANYSFLNEGFGKSAIINSAVRDGSANVCNLAVLEGCCSTLPAYGIHVRQLRSEAQFPYSIENLLTYCIHDHSMTSRNGAMTKWEYILTYRNALSRIKGINTKKRLAKIMEAYPNFHFLASASEESLIEIMGKQVGMTIYAVLRYQGLMTDEWRNNKFHDGTDKILIPEEDPKSQSRCDPAGNTFLNKNTTLVNTPIPPADDNDKATCGLPPISHVAIPITNTKPNVQEKDLKLASSSIHPPSSPATTFYQVDEVQSFEMLPMKEGKETPLSTHRMSARVQLEAYLQKPHTLQECVDKHDNFTKGVIWEHIARMKREGVVIEFDNGTLVMAK